MVHSLIPFLPQVLPVVLLWIVLRLRMESTLFFQRVLLLGSVTFRKKEMGGKRKQNSSKWSVSLTCFPFSISRTNLIQEQQKDPFLAELFQQVRSVEEMESMAHGYFEDNMLVWKWLPQGDTYFSDAILQIVVPTKPRDGILRTAHNLVAGHFKV